MSTTSSSFKGVKYAPPPPKNRNPPFPVSQASAPPPSKGYHTAVAPCPPPRGSGHCFSARDNAPRTEVSRGGGRRDSGGSRTSSRRLSRHPPATPAARAIVARTIAGYRRPVRRLARKTAEAKRLRPPRWLPAPPPTRHLGTPPHDRTPTDTARARLRGV